MTDPIFTNANILKAITTINKEAFSDITKNDISAVFIILLAFKNKASSLKEPITKIQKTRLIDRYPLLISDASYFSLNLNKIIQLILDKLDKNIDGKPKTSKDKINFINAKKNLARIMYFIALDACDAIVDNDMKSRGTKQYKPTQIENTISVKSKRVHYDYAPELKTLFIIASSLADNKVENRLGGDLEEKIESDHLLKFIKDIVLETDTDTRITTTTTAAFPITTFNTHLPKIKDAEDYAINLRVIQTVLIGYCVFDSTKDTLVLKEPETTFINDVIKNVLDNYKIFAAAFVQI